MPHIANVCFAKQAENALARKKSFGQYRSMKPGDGMTAQDVITAIGGTSAVAQALGLTARSVQIAIQNNQFPASWYAGIIKLHGDGVPLCLFAMREVQG